MKNKVMLKSLLKKEYRRDEVTRYKENNHGLRYDLTIIRQLEETNTTFAKYIPYIEFTHNGSTLMIVCKAMDVLHEAYYKVSELFIRFIESEGVYRNKNVAGIFFNNKKI